MGGFFVYLKLKPEKQYVFQRPRYECRWATNTVAHILENREYTGCLVNFKTEKVSYKVKLSANRLVHVPICRHI